MLKQHQLRGELKVRSTLSVMLTSLYDENIPTGHNGTFQRDTNNKYIYAIMIVPKL